MTRWALEDVADEETGVLAPTLVRYMGAGKLDPQEREEMGSVNDFVRLFKACQNRWHHHGWDIDKLITAVNECEFD